MNSQRNVAVFTKAPVPGRVNTRLVPPLTDEQAAELQGAWIRDAMERPYGMHTGETHRTLFVSGESVLWREASARGWQIRVQEDGDLGARLLAAFPAAEQRAMATVCLGTDAPDLPNDYVEEAFNALAAHEVVLGPTFDGGYYLIGARQRHPALFEKMPWSTANLAAETIRRAASKSLSTAIIAPWWDIDTIADLRRFELHSKQPWAGLSPWRPERSILLARQLLAERCT